ncbi:MAG: hypothetical protein K2P28_08540, partial [Lachnospiraceae bacterium]|nr:hypothetical protein [Lachnospiraceae bacterium]
FAKITAKESGKLAKTAAKSRDWLSKAAQTGMKTAQNAGKNTKKAARTVIEGGSAFGGSLLTAAGSLSGK